MWLSYEAAAAPQREDASLAIVRGPAEKLLLTNKAFSNMIAKKMYFLNAATFRGEWLATRCHVKQAHVP